RRLTRTGSVNTADRRQVGVDVKGGDKIDDPVADGDADVGDQPVADEHAGPAGALLRRQFQAGQDVRQDRLELAEVAVQVEAEAVQRDDGVDGQLAGQGQ